MSFLDFALNLPMVHRALHAIDPVVKFRHEHPNEYKVTVIALVAIGLVAMTFFALLTLEGWAVGLAITGSVLAPVTLIANKLINWFRPHDMNTHVFTPTKVVGGELSYVGDVPILRLDGRNPYKAGRVHGYLLGKHIAIMKRKWKFVMQKILKVPNIQDIEGVLRSIQSQIPEKYIQELRGLVNGYNRWAEENHAAKVSFDEVLLLHLLPDIAHFHPARLKTSSSVPAFGCSVVADRDRESGHMVVGRNMDWVALEENGKRSLCFVQEKADGSQVAYIGLPGFVGGLTGINHHGFSAMLNVSPGRTTRVEGMPSCFALREVLEGSQTVLGADWVIQRTRALGPFHLTVADQNEARTYHIQQRRDGLHTVRSGLPLMTFNARHPSRDKQELPYYGNSDHRERVVTRHSQSARTSRDFVEESIQQPKVNNFLTTHSVIFYPGARGDQELLRVSFNNGFAARGESYRSLRWSDLFNAH